MKIKKILSIIGFATFSISLHSSFAEEWKKHLFFQDQQRYPQNKLYCQQALHSGEYLNHHPSIVLASYPQNFILESTCRTKSLQPTLTPITFDAALAKTDNIPELVRAQAIAAGAIATDKDDTVFQPKNKINCIQHRIKQLKKRNGQSLFFSALEQRKEEIIQELGSLRSSKQYLTAQMNQISQQYNNTRNSSDKNNLQNHFNTLQNNFKAQSEQANELREEFENINKKIQEKQFISELVQNFNAHENRTLHQFQHNGFRRNRDFEQNNIVTPQTPINSANKRQ